MAKKSATTTEAGAQVIWGEPLNNKLSTVTLCGAQHNLQSTVRPLPRGCCEVTLNGIYVIRFLC